MDNISGLIQVIIVVTAIAVGVVLLPFALWKGFKLVAWFVRHIFAFIGGMLGDSLRLVGGIITSIVFLPLVVMNVAIGRWSASKHFWIAFQDEIVGVGHCAYRLAIGHPARLLLMTPLTEGIEKRFPAAVAQAPTSDRPSKRTGSFEGYTIVGSLKGGGSGGKLYIAEPDRSKRAAFSKRGNGDHDRVVIKSFSVHEGSTLPQIVRESRALEAARDVGLVLDHELTPDRFYYAMPYVPGDNLSIVTERLHTRSDAEGLGRDQLVSGLGYIADLLRTLTNYHDAGLWHKDIKPDNIIVSRDGHAHLVDLGLVTPLRSAMTLTTHGTEYFRDPELVRLALRGVKVHEVDGVKFDVYGAGACLFSLVERSFPAHGGLSQVSKRCPEALRWIVRRSMAEMHQRYASAAEMLADLEAVRTARDPFAMTPADLPSMRGGAVHEEPARVEHASFTPPTPPAGTPQPPRAAPAPPAPQARRKRGFPVRVTGWWSGRYEPVGERRQQAAQTPLVPVDRRRPAADQLRSARERAAGARARAHQRMGQRRAGGHSSRGGGNKVFLAAGMILLFFVVVVGGLGALLLTPAMRSSQGGYASATVTRTHDTHDVFVSYGDVTRINAIAPASIVTGGYFPEERPYSYVVLDPNGVLDEYSGDAAEFVRELREAGGDVETEPDVETEARLLATVADALPGNTEATDGLRRWVNTMGHGYDAVIWFAGPGAGESTSPMWELVFAGNGPLSLWSAEEGAAEGLEVIVLPGTPDASVTPDVPEAPEPADEAQIY